jgi:hypothetical protein
LPILPQQFVHEGYTNACKMGGILFQDSCMPVFFFVPPSKKIEFSPCPIPPQFLCSPCALLAFISFPSE